MQLTDFPGFAYVDGGTWIVEPDEKATATSSPDSRGRSEGGFVRGEVAGKGL